MKVPVSGSSLKLKCLELVRCLELTKVEIFVVKLVSFKYYGPNLETEFKIVSSLMEASFEGFFGEFVRESFMLPIKVLKLDVNYFKVFVKALISSERTCLLVSVENEYAIIVSPSQHGKYIVVFDLLDGFSNVDCGVSIGISRT
ncbi:hypothetical protein RYX36_009454 [Vicia faba]